MKKRKTYKGIYTPENPNKYIGDANNIVFRSLWERQVMVYLDKNTNVLSWGSEELIIPYISPVDNSFHRYFPDFIAEVKQTDGTTKKLVLEIKPHNQTVPPKKPARQTAKYLEELQTYAVNDAKFEAANLFCEARGWDFKVITEHDLFPKKKP
jgi:hypothetical protein